MMLTLAVLTLLCLEGSADTSSSESEQCSLHQKILLRHGRGALAAHSEEDQPHWPSGGLLDALLAPPTKCVNKDFTVPCYYFQNQSADWTPPEIQRLTRVQEINLASYHVEDVNTSIPGSLHEFAVKPVLDSSPISETEFFVTRQAPVSMITRIKSTGLSPQFGTPAQVHVEAQELGDRVDLKVIEKLQERLQHEPTRQDVSLKHAGLHGFLVSNATDAARAGGIAYLTLQFIDAIGVFDMNRNTLVDISLIPCPRFNLAFVPEMDAAPYGLNLSDCAGPHTVAEDSDGNLYVTFKTAGGLGALRNPLTCEGARCWRYFPLPVTADAPNRPVPFYIISSKSVNRPRQEEFIYLNDIANSRIGIVRLSATKWPPLALDTMQLPASDTMQLSNDMVLPGHRHRTGLRPGGILGLRNGAALYTAYNQVGVLIYVDAYSHYQTEMLLPMDNAYLHICGNPTNPNDTSDNRVDIMVLASSNDFAFMPEADKPDHLQYQPDLLRRIRAFDPVKLAQLNCSSATTEGACVSKGPACQWSGRLGKPRCLSFILEATNEVIMAPTQNSWFHRVYCLPSRLAPWDPFINEWNTTLSYSVHFATELYTDRLMLVQSRFVNTTDPNSMPEDPINVDNMDPMNA